MAGKGELLFEFKEEGFEEEMRKTKGILLLTLYFSFFTMTVAILYDSIEDERVGEAAAYLVFLLALLALFHKFVDSLYPKGRNVRVFQGGLEFIYSDLKLVGMFPERRFLCFSEIPDITVTGDKNLKLSYTPRDYLLNPSGHGEEILEAYKKFKDDPKVVKAKTGELPGENEQGEFLFEFEEIDMKKRKRETRMYWYLAWVVALVVYALLLLVGLDLELDAGIGGSEPQGKLMAILGPWAVLGVCVDFVLIIQIPTSSRIKVFQGGLEFDYGENNPSNGFIHFSRISGIKTFSSGAISIRVGNLGADNRIVYAPEHTKRLLEVYEEFRKNESDAREW